jgi:hypothetical protein
MKKLFPIGFFITSLFSAPVQANTVYTTYTAMTPGGGIGISGVSSAATPFYLQNSTNLTQATISIWSIIPDLLEQNVDWAITTSAFGGTVESSGIAVPLTLITPWPYNYFNDYTFSLPMVKLAAGTYYLQLSNGVGIEGGGSWALSASPDATVATTIGANNGVIWGSMGTAVFSLQGTAVTTVPLPTSIWIFTSGLLGLGVLRKVKV